MTASYSFFGARRGGEAGHSVASAGDVDGDGLADILVGAWRAEEGIRDGGDVFLVSSRDFAAADAADGQIDGVIDLGNVRQQPHSYQFIGPTTAMASSTTSYIGESVGSAGDVDGDGLSDILIGAGTASGSRGAAYLVAASDLTTADAADGSLDGIIDIRLIEQQPGSYRFGEPSLGNSGLGASVASAGDVDGDGRDDIVISADRSSLVGSVSDRAGAVFVLAADDLAAADAADGAADGLIDVGNVAAQPGSFGIGGQSDSFDLMAAVGWDVSAGRDVNGDGVPDLLIGAPTAYNASAGDGPRTRSNNAGEAHLVSFADLAAADAADGATDGIVNLEQVHEQPDSYQFLAGNTSDQNGWAVDLAGDVGGDGLSDILIGANRADIRRPDSGEVYLVSSAVLEFADAGPPNFGNSDISIARIDRLDDSYVFVGAQTDDEAGSSVASLGDIDGDGLADFAFGARRADDGGEDAGVVYVFTAASLDPADAADGETDGIIDLRDLDGLSGVYRIIGVDETDEAGHSLASAGDIDGDGTNDLLIGAPGANTSGRPTGEVYLLATADLPEADAADGAMDGVIDLGIIPFLDRDSAEPEAPFGFDAIVDLFNLDEFDLPPMTTANGARSFLSDIGAQGAYEFLLDTLDAEDTEEALEALGVSPAEVKAFAGDLKLSEFHETAAFFGEEPADFRLFLEGIGAFDL